MRRTLLVVILVASIGALAGSTASTRPALAASCDPIQTPPVFQGQAPTAQAVLGFGLGSQEVTAAEADRYVQAVDAASTGSSAAFSRRPGKGARCATRWSGSRST